MAVHRRRVASRRHGPHGPAAIEVPPARFTPAHPVRWAVVTGLALVTTAAIGIAIPRLMDPLVRALPAPAAGRPMMPWVQPTLGLGYAGFVITVIGPFVVFWAWSRSGRPATGSPRRGPDPRVSILIPALNEQELILDAIHAALGQDYPDFEVIVIDDGSTDLTAHLARTTPVHLIRHPRNRGKAAALNSGLAVARGAVIVTCDADSYLDPLALRYLVEPLADPRVGGVAGQVRLFHPSGVLRRFQVLEYDHAQALLKQAQAATTGSVLVAPGPVSAFPADLLRAIGGVPDETLTEDFDLTLQVISRGRCVAYEPRAVAYTDAPRTDAELRRQRVRWARGGFQVLHKYRSLVGGRGRGLIGLFWLPFALVSGYLAIPIAIGLAALVPVLAWGSRAPIRFLECLGLYALLAVAVEVLALGAGVVASDWRHLRFIIHAPVFVLYKKLRLSWFTAQAVYHEWRQVPKSWHG